jgi:hypothetical protein
MRDREEESSERERVREWVVVTHDMEERLKELRIERKQIGNYYSRYHRMKYWMRCLEDMEVGNIRKWNRMKRGG